MSTMTAITRRALGMGAMMVSGVLLGIVSEGTQASIVEFKDIKASWVNIDPSIISADGNGTGTASIEWGFVTAPNEKSAYLFQAATGSSSVNLNTAPAATLDLGTWTHKNNAVQGDPLLPFNGMLNMATLQLDLSVFVDAIDVGTHRFLFDFSHTESDDTASICANGEARGVGNNLIGCADIVDIAYNTQSDGFLVNGTAYTINVLSALRHLETQEGKNNAFGIMGTIQERTHVISEPSVMVLLGLGLLSLGLKRRRKGVARLPLVSNYSV